MLDADGQQILAQRGDDWTIVDRETGEFTVLALNRGSEPNWHPTNPELIRHLAGENASTGDMVLLETRIDGTSETLVDLREELTTALPGALYIHSSQLGAPSADSNRYVWAVYNDAENVIGFVTYDLASQEIVGLLEAVPTGELGVFDSVAMSKSGDSVVLAWADEMIVYDADFTNERRLGQGVSLYDLASSANGDDVLITTDLDSGRDSVGWVVTYNLDTGATTRLHDLFTEEAGNASIDFSGAAIDRPGWVLASSYGCGDGTGWSCDRIMAWNVDDGTIVNLAHTYGCADSVFTEPRAVVNSDFTQGWFNTDFGSCGEDASVVEITIGPLE